MKRNRNEKRKTLLQKIVIISLIIVLVVIGVFTIKDSLIKMDKAKNLSQNILNIYINAKK